jgi:hypothetical protein
MSYQGKHRKLDKLPDNQGDCQGDGRVSGQDRECVTKSTVPRTLASVVILRLRLFAREGTGCLVHNSADIGKPSATRGIFFGTPAGAGRFLGDDLLHDWLICRAF